MFIATIKVNDTTYKTELTHTPFLDAARLAIEHGADPEQQIGMFRPGMNEPALIGTSIGFVARLVSHGHGFGSYDKRVAGRTIARALSQERRQRQGADDGSGRAKKAARRRPTKGGQHGKA